MYDNINKKITAYGADRRAEFEKMTENVTVGQVRANWYLRRYLTSKTAERAREMQDAERVPVEIVERMRAKRAREILKEVRVYMERVELVEQYELPSIIHVVVEWTASRTWGKNPRAIVTGEKRRSESRASGCGYDKESAAIAGALNQNPEVLRILYDYAESGASFPYGVSLLAGVPYFSAGCGVDVFYEIFDQCGYDVAMTRGGNVNVYTIIRR